MGTVATGTITANGQAVTAPVGRTDQTARLAVWGTHAGITLSFEVSPDDGTTWLTAVAGRVDTATTAANSQAVGTNAGNVFVIPVSGMTQVRARSIAYTSGTMNVRVAVVADPAPQLSTSAVVDTELPAAAALADTASNPTAPLLGAGALLWNGASWDRARGNAVNVNVDSLLARTASGTGVTFTNHNGREVVWFVNVTVVSGTSPTMTVRVQESYDGTAFRDVDTTNLQTASITAAGVYKLAMGPGLPNTANASANVPALRLLRLAWTIGGTSPSFTMSTYAHASV